MKTLEIHQKKEFSLEMLTSLNIFRSVSSTGLIGASQCDRNDIDLYLTQLGHYLSERPSFLPRSSLASSAAGSTVRMEQAAFLRNWALAPEQCCYWYLNVIWKFGGHLRPFSFLTPQDLILTLAKLNLWPAISSWVWPFHSVFIMSNTEKAVFSFIISSGNVLAVTPSPWLYTHGLISTRSI